MLMTKAPLLFITTWLVSLACAEPQPDGATTGGGLEQQNEVAGQNRQDKGFNVIKIVKFDNAACTTASGESGVCYTASECSANGGSNSGSCASGFGVCCYFRLECGATTSLNNTYFQSSGQETSPCQLSVCKSSTDICQIRLDFNTFDLDQPVSSNLQDDTQSAKTQCQTGRFTATTDSGSAPVICGTNTNQHMILEASDTCNKLQFVWTSSSTTRSWNIKISQIPCNVPWKAPEGCLQYFTGATGTVKSYNYDGGVQLADQNYVNCIRQEEGYCSIGYSSSTTSFQISSISTGSASGLYGADCTTDYVFIPRAGPTTAPGSNNYDRFCGGVLTSNSPTTNTILTRRLPFQIGVYFDSGEKSPTSGVENSLGFSIYYSQSSSC